MLLCFPISGVISASFAAMDHCTASSDQFIPESYVKDLKLPGLHAEGNSDHLIMSALDMGTVVA